MKQLLLVFSVVALVGCGKKAIIADPIVEEAVRQQLNAQGDKPTGELTKADLEKVTGLDCSYIQLTSVKGLEKLTQLEELVLENNPDLTKDQIAKLKRALPNCEIRSNPTK